METEAAGTLRKQIKHLYERDFMILIGAVPVEWPLSALLDRSVFQSRATVCNATHKNSAQLIVFITPAAG